MKLYNSRKVLDWMDFLQKVNDRIEENRAEMISSLSRLISIPSVATDAKGSCPFGEDVQKAYDMIWIWRKVRASGLLMQTATAVT